MPASDITNRAAPCSTTPWSSKSNYSQTCGARTGNRASAIVITAAELNFGIGVAPELPTVEHRTGLQCTPGVFPNQIMAARIPHVEIHLREVQSLLSHSTVK